MVEAIHTTNVIIVEESTGGFGFAAQASYELGKLGKNVAVLSSKESVIPSARRAEEEVLVQADDIYKEVKAVFAEE